MAVITNDGLDFFTRYGLGITTAGFTLSLRLFINAATPSVSSITASFAECTLAGYAPITLIPSSWIGVTAGGLSQYGYPQQTWIFPSYIGPPQTIYGYFVTVSTTARTLWCDVGIPSYPVPLGGGSLNLTLSFNDANLP
jgi:hypothetical protein